MKRLSAIAKIRMGATLRGKDALKRDDRSDVRYIRIGDMGDDGHVNAQQADPVMVPSAEYDKHRLKRGDILLANRGARTDASLFDSDLKAVAGGQFFILTPNPGNVLPKYLCWFLNLSSTQETFAGQMQGSALKGISRTTLASLEIPLPSLETQEMIVSIDHDQKELAKINLRINERKQAYLTQQLLNLARANS